MTPSFNLVTEPWIPCLLSGRRLQACGLLEVLVRSPDILEIYHPSPLVVTAVYRLLLAILHRTFGPATPAAWIDLWRRGRWDEGVLRDYFHRWQTRFDLFHPEHPFYQVPAMAEARDHPVQLLALEAAAGNNTVLFDHHYADRPATFTPAQAALHLLARQAYAIGFGKSSPFYFQDSPLIRGYTLFLKGNTLWETLILNLQVYNREKPLPIPPDREDLPPWERETLPPPEPKGNPVDGYVHYLTWLSRRIHLRPEADPPVVRFCQIQQNWKLPDSPRLDPFKAYRRDEKEGWVPRGLSPERAVWRDSQALFAPQERPEILNWAARVEQARRTGRITAQARYAFTLTGLVTEAGKAASIILWRQEHLPLPLAYLEDKALLDRLQEALALAEQAHTILRQQVRRLIQHLLAPDRNADTKEVNRLFQDWAPDRIFWSGLEVPFRRLLVDLPADQAKNDDEVTYGHHCLPLWRDVVRRQAQAAFHQTVASLRFSGRGLKAVALVENSFQAQLYQQLHLGGEA